MPQYTEPPEEMTPFAQVLVDFMWNKRPRNQPPLSYAQLAVRLGVPKQSISNWILRGSVPPLDTIMIILKKLRIPFSDLFSAYQQAGLPVPAWDHAELAGLEARELEARDARAATSAASTTPATSATTTPASATSAGTSITGTGEAGQKEPVTPRSRKPAKAPMAIPEHERGPEPRPYIPPARPYDPEAERQAAWERIAWQAEETLRAEGASEDVIQRILTHLRQEQAGAAPTFSRYIQAEHTEPAEPAEPTKQPKAHDEPAAEPDDGKKTRR